jgi:hypothetical protein
MRIKLMIEAISAFSSNPALPTRPMPIAQLLGSGWMPAIYYPDRTVEYLRFERFPRKAKATSTEALLYAGRVLWYREHRAAEKRRRLEATVHPHYLAYLRPYLEAAE